MHISVCVCVNVCVRVGAYVCGGGEREEKRRKKERIKIHF